ncbi:hypothetical protein C1646_751431 [Rhizophagus diaphanus]|nr:hypothetical protein C1646_751431 [Rhizophagus diaphanus] [Rhizophagus sp. MUCL 43196]
MSYNDVLINLDHNVLNLLMALHNKLMEQHLSKVPNHYEHSEYYLINIKTGECTCFDYIWNGPFRDTCKHYHAALIYQEAIKSSNMLLFIQEIKKELVQYFKNKQRVLPIESKNISIYNEDIETAYLEIVNLYNTNELNNYKSNNGALPKSSAKPRKPSRILKDTDQNTPFSEQIRSAKRIRKNIHSSYIYPTNLPISFPSTTSYYSNSLVQLNNCSLTQNSYSFMPYLANANSYSESTHNNMMSSTPMPNFSNSDS